MSITEGTHQQQHGKKPEMNEQNTQIADVKRKKVITNKTVVFNTLRVLGVCLFDGLLLILFSAFSLLFLC